MQDLFLYYSEITLQLRLDVVKTTLRPETLKNRPQSDTVAL
jgi:hypothetical protein